MIGAAFNQYRITASIGAGGMGEVFRARDTRLNRDVAIKVLPKDFVSDADRSRRFEQEAKTLAALNHPNILTIHDAGVHNGAPYLVSELLEGRTLREEMNGVALPVRKATDYALQIAQGLAAAHAKGVIHRDLKPENVFVTEDGRVKILDFGLAKLKEPSPRPSPVGRERENDPAATIRLDADAIINTTEPGLVLGTPAYMSPEQVRGEPADHRADIFAFGCVSYEMLSGTRAFRRDTPVATMNAVLNEDPPELSAANPNIPAALERIVHRCLEKQPDRRFHSAHDLAFALEAVSATSLTVQQAWKPRHAARQLTAVAAIAFAILAVAVVIFKPWKRDVSQSSARPQAIHRKFELYLPTPVRKTLMTGDPLHLAISPDGRKIAYANGEGLWLRWLDQMGPPVHLVASEKIVHPFWSPQSTHVAYFDGTKLARVSIQGGRPLTIASVPGLAQTGGGAAGGAWLSNDQIFFATGEGGLNEVSAQGGAVTAVWQPKQEDDELDLHEASPLPDAAGTLVVVHRRKARPGPDTIAVRKNSGERKVIFQEPGGDLASPIYSRTGHLLYERSGEGLWAFRFSLEKLERTGEPFRVSDTGTGPSVSDDGALVLIATDSDVFAPRRLIWVSRAGTPLTAFGPALPCLHAPRLSQDERRVLAIAGENVVGLDVWLLDVAGGALPLTRNSTPEFLPYWRKDTQSILFTRDDGRAKTFTKPVDGTGDEQVLFDGGGTPSPDGKHILVRGEEGGNNARERAARWRYVEISGTNTWPFRIEEVFGRINAAPAFSPDGRWLAVLVRGQPNEIWVVDFPQITQRMNVSRGGGHYPLWHPNGRELFFLSPDRKTMMSAQRKPDDSGFEEPRKLFDLPETIYSGYPQLPVIYDVAADGERFLMLQKAGDSSSTNQTARPNVLLVENWFEEFRGKK